MSQSSTAVREPLLRIAKREGTTMPQKIAVRAIAILLALVVDALFIYFVTGLNPLAVYGVMWGGTFANMTRFSWMLRDLSILLCVGIALAPAFKMRFWNCGGEGQILIGGLIAALVMVYQGNNLPERFVKIPVSVEIASEYRYSYPLTNERTLCIVVSQSGETIDTLAALKEAKRLGAKSLAVTNSIGSSIAREADRVIYTLAGPEIAVASTKAYTTQLVALLLLALYMGQLKGTLSGEEIRTMTDALKTLPGKIEEVLKEKDHMANVAEKLIKARDIFYLGRSIDYAIAMEGALKLKEVSYIHAESYAAGELKHGTLALIAEDTPVLAVATQDDVSAKMYSNIQEVRVRGAEVLGIGYDDDTEIAKYTTETVRIPRVAPFIAPILAVIPMQLLAYYTSIKRGNDVDKPRNLAKSVTVE